MRYIIFLFHSAHHSIWGNKLVKSLKIEQKLMPVPRKFSSDCGYCLKIKEEDREKVTELFQTAGVEFDRTEYLD